MAVDNPRILELRRRVQADPVTIAFAQLAEECRRAGEADEAIGICRAGLAHHPGYLSARVTLGRALMEVGRLDEAAVELSTVVQSAPTNVPAIRGLAEIHQQRGNLAPVLASVLAPPTPVKVAELFDFDTLSRQLGETLPKLASLDRTSVGGPSPIDAVDLSLHQNDAFADVERDLRERVEQRAADDKAARMLLAAQRQSAIVAELEDWLAAIAVDRRTAGAAGQAAAHG